MKKLLFLLCGGMVFGESWADFEMQKMAEGSEPEYVEYTEEVQGHCDFEKMEKYLAERGYTDVTDFEEKVIFAQLAEN